MLNREDWLMIDEMHERGFYQREMAAELGASETGRWIRSSVRGSARRW